MANATTDYPWNPAGMGKEGTFPQIGPNIVQCIHALVVTVKRRSTVR